MKESSNNVLLEELDKNGVFRITLNDPKNKNALSNKMISALVNTFENAIESEKIKVIVIASTSNVFCSGHDLKELKSIYDKNDNKKSFFLNLFKSCSNLMKLIVDCPKPVIAEINGIATAAGCQLVATCDLAIASETSSFATPGVNIGLFCSTPMVALSRNVSKKDSMRMLLTGDFINAAEAKRISLINDLVPDEVLTEFVMDLAEKISKKSQTVLKIGKEAFYKQSLLNLEDAYEYASNVMTENMMKDVAEEGIDSFLEKRNPDWTDK